MACLREQQKIHLISDEVYALSTSGDDFVSGAINRLPCRLIDEQPLARAVWHE